MNFLELLITDYNFNNCMLLSPKNSYVIRHNTTAQCSCGARLLTGVTLKITNLRGRANIYDATTTSNGQKYTKHIKDQHTVTERYPAYIKIGKKSQD